MSDIKDIMGMSRGGPATEKQEKPKEQKLVKPKGMSRYVFCSLSLLSLKQICSILTALKLTIRYSDYHIPPYKISSTAERLLRC